MTDDELTEIIIGCAYKVHNKLGSGFFEKVYENALRIEIEKAGLTVRQQEPIKVFYEGQIVGDYLADLWVENQIIIELKAIQSLAKENEVQLVNYLTATGVDSGLLLNFGSSVQVKRKYRQSALKNDAAKSGWRDWLPENADVLTVNRLHFAAAAKLRRQ